MPKDVEPGLPTQDDSKWNLGDEAILDQSVPVTVTGSDSSVRTRYSYCLD